MTLGEYIIKYREEHELSGRAFAALIGVSPQYEVNLERGMNNHGKPLSPTMAIYSKIAKGTGISEVKLLEMLDDNVLVNAKLTDQQIEFLRLMSLLSDQEVDFLLAQLKGLVHDRQGQDGQ